MKGYKTYLLVMFGLVAVWTAYYFGSVKIAEASLVTLFGLIAASLRDSIKSLSVIVLMVGLVGCSSLQSAKITQAETIIKNMPVTQVTLPVSGQDETGINDVMKGVFPGTAATGAQVDELGIHVLGGSPMGLLAFHPGTGMFFISSPRDVVMRGVEFTPNPEPGQPSFKADEISANLSSVIAVLNQQYSYAMTAMVSMTKEQAEVWIKNAEVAGDIVPDLAEMLLKSFVPTLPD